MGQINVVSHANRSAFILSGPPLVQIQRAWAASKRRKLVESQETLGMCRAWVKYRATSAAHAYFVKELCKGKAPAFHPPPPPLATTAAADESRALQSSPSSTLPSSSNSSPKKISLNRFIPSIVRRWLRKRVAIDDFRVAQFRKISVIFISLDIINGNAGSQTLRNLSIAMNVLRHRALRSALTLCHFMVEDKDVIAMLALGLPGMAKEMMCVNALRAANRMGKQLSHKGIACSMGVSTGRAYCGFIGNTHTRCEYTVLGDVVNLAARLMMEAKRRRTRETRVKEEMSSHVDDDA